jgi:hypothetical protein
MSLFRRLCTVEPRKEKKKQNQNCLRWNIPHSCCPVQGARRLLPPSTHRVWHTKLDSILSIRPKRPEVWQRISGSRRCSTEDEASQAHSRPCAAGPALFPSVAAVCCVTYISWRAARSEEADGSPTLPRVGKSQHATQSSSEHAPESANESQKSEGKQKTTWHASAACTLPFLP